MPIEPAVPFVRVNRLPVLTASIAFVVSFFVFASFFLALPVIPDTDSYYHLAVAREYANGHYLEALPWARFSILGETFGDKEFLFHAALAPFTMVTDAATGGRIALAVANATLVAVITAAATQALGWWGLAVPLWMYVSAPMMAFRLVRLRPETAALLLMIVLIYFASSRRYLGVAVVAAVFALSYTAVHVVVGLPILWFLYQYREREWKLPIAATLGATIGLLVHPGFPDNLRIWWVQNVLVLMAKSKLDAGTEFDAPTTHFIFIDNFGWWIGVGLLAWTARNVVRNKRGVAFSAIAAAVFGILTVLMQRMAVHFVPLITLIFLYKLAPLPRARAALLGVALLGAAMLSFPESHWLYKGVLADTDTGMTLERDYARLGKAVPAGAKVAAHWGTGESYAFWAPQGRYLNVLDPLFMALPYPDAYRAQRIVFEGREPDVPLVVKRTLDSDYIAFRMRDSQELYERVQNDPRVIPLYRGYAFLGRIDLKAMDRFVLDWQLQDGRAFPGPATGGGYIDASLVSRDGCASFTREGTVTSAVTRVYEFAPWGPAELQIDDALHVNVKAITRAVLGRGLVVRVDLKPGIHHFRVTTCAAADGRNGFYLLDRTKY